MTEPIRLCCDCRFYKKNWFDHLLGMGDGSDRCLHPVLNGNRVTGKVKGGRYCSFMRMYGSGCGEEGKYFEPKNPHKDT